MGYFCQWNDSWLDHCHFQFYTSSTNYPISKKNSSICTITRTSKDVHWNPSDLFAYCCLSIPVMLIKTIQFYCQDDDFNHNYKVMAEFVSCYVIFLFPLVNLHSLPKSNETFRSIMFSIKKIRFTSQIWNKNKIVSFRRH